MSCLEISLWGVRFPRIIFLGYDNPIIGYGIKLLYMTSNALNIAQDLIRHASVTAGDAGEMQNVLDMLQARLEVVGFVCTRYPFGEGDERVDNLYARFGTAAPNFCFAGHVDVVPEGESESWSEAPYAGVIKDGQLWGRGASDMKGAIAAFVAATETYLASTTPQGSISFLITGDEEGIAINGTKPLLDAITQDGEVIDDCLVGEPTNPSTMGEMLKNGRRGSINAEFIVTGRQGHVAYPYRASNPAPVLVDILSDLTARKLDDGAEFFQPSNLEITTIDIGNRTENMIPEAARARVNIRFNTHHTGVGLKAWFEEVAAKAGEAFDGEVEVKTRISGESFITDPCKLTDVVQDAAESVIGRRPELSTSGGTSDARFITHYANVVEFGLVGATMHQVDERVDVADIDALTAIYGEVLKRYFG